jgi:hypothetical protein
LCEKEKSASLSGAQLKLSLLLYFCRKGTRVLDLAVKVYPSGGLFSWLFVYMFGNMWLCLHGSHSDVTGLLTTVFARSCSPLGEFTIIRCSFYHAPFLVPQWQGSVNVLNALVPETLKDADSAVTPIFTFNFGSRGPAGQAAGPRVPCGSTIRMGFVRVSFRVGSDDL